MARRTDKADLPGSSAFGAMMLLIAVGFAAFSQARNWAVIAAVAGLGILGTVFGSGRVYRPAVERTTGVIICRFNPWREASFYLVLIGLPLFSMIPLAGPELGRSGAGFWRFLGVFMLALMPVFLFLFIRQRRNSLEISPTGLKIRRLGQEIAPAEIPRAAVNGITATTAQLRNSDTAPATQISYRDADQDPAATRTVLLGPTNTKKTVWLTVEQADLLAALQAWRDGDPNDPRLMDRLEGILRGRTLDNTH